MDIRAEIERIHATKVAGKPVRHCLRDVVQAAARMGGAEKLPFDKICADARETARVAAGEYDWAVTLRERQIVQFDLNTYTAQWVTEALSGEPDGPPSPNPQPIAEAEHQAAIARLAADLIQAKAPRATVKRARFPECAAWLQARLAERKWTKHDLARCGGPDHKTTQKVLDGFGVQDGVLQKIAQGLSTAKNWPEVSVTEIPKK